jgi:hypothetical protein
MMRSLLLVALAAAAASAQADMYRYRDPVTGQMKLTNIPPPWLAKPGAAAPRTEVLRDQAAPAAPAAAKPATESAAESPAPAPSAGAGAPAQAFELERQRKLLLQQLVADAPNVGTPAGKQRFLAKLGDVVSVESRMDKLDPAGRKSREIERNRAMEQCADGFAQALTDPNAQLEFTGEILRWLGDRVVQCARGQC